MTEALHCTVRPADQHGPAPAASAATATATAGEVTFEIAADAPVLHQMVRRSVRALPVGCRGGGCGVCRVRVIEGDYRTLRMSRRHVSEADEGQRIALACRLLASSDIVIEPAPPAAGAVAQPGTTTLLPIPPRRPTWR